MKVSRETGDRVITHSLGSCIGVSVYDPAVRVGGLLHYQLPSSTGAGEQEKAERNPFMYADTGIPVLLEAVCRWGAAKSRLIVKLCGGANIMDPSGIFRIGQRNHVAARKILWRAGLLIAAEDVGGQSWRTMVMEIETGDLIVKTSSGEYRI